MYCSVRTVCIAVPFGRVFSHISSPLLLFFFQHGVEPCLTREGGSIPITQVFEEVCNATCVLLPIGASDDGAHSQNEKIDRSNYVNGIKTLACYIDELARLPAQQDALTRAAAAAAAARRNASNKWRRRCTIDQTTFGCDCLECDGIAMSTAA